MKVFLISNNALLDYLNYENYILDLTENYLDLRNATLVRITGFENGKTFANLGYKNTISIQDELNNRKIYISVYLYKRWCNLWKTKNRI